MTNQELAAKLRDSIECLIPDIPPEMAELFYEAARRLEAMCWRDIKDAPRDGTEFLAYGFYIYPGDKTRTEYYRVACYDNSDGDEFPWQDEECGHPDGFFTHYMPLPEPPKGDQS